MRIPDPLVRHIFEPLWDLYEGSVRLKTLRHLQETQYHSPSQIKAAQDGKLVRMVQHAARTCSFYRQRFAEAGLDPTQIQGIEDLQNLPLLTKADVRNNAEGIISSDYRRDDLVPAKTGGSTGVSLQIYCDRRGIEQRNAAALRSDEWSGWRRGQPHGAVWGNPPVPVTWRNKIRCLFKDRCIYLDTMRIDDAAVARIEERARWLFPQTEAAREGMTLELGCSPERCVA